MEEIKDRNLIPWTKGHPIVTVRTYAKKKGVTTQQVYNWIKSGKAKQLVIDGVKFIIDQ